MTEEPEHRVEEVSAEIMRKRAEQTYKTMGELGQSMKQMAYCAGMMDAVDLVAKLLHTVRTDGMAESKFPRPPVKLDVATLDYLLSLMGPAVVDELKRSQFVQMEIDVTTGIETEMPPGTKPN